jgi:5-methylcytosine-specific restriction endonuclease McrA
MSRFSKDELRAILRKTDSRCHICWKKVYLNNHGLRRARGGWEVDHSNPRARGGGDHVNNYLPACCGCNVAKGARTTRSARRSAGHGKTKAPLSKEKQAAARLDNAVGAGVLGGILGGLVGGPPGAALGTGLGALLGGSAEVE